MANRNQGSRAQTMADRLVHLMDEQGWSYRSLAARIGKSHTTVGNWCHGGTITDKDLRDLARVLQVSPSWLRYGHAGASGQLQEALLQRVIAHIESYLAASGVQLPAEQRARVIATAYEATVRAGGQMISDEALSMLIAMADT